MRLAILQPTIKVDVAFYDDDEKAKLLSYPTATEIQQIVNQGAEIATTDFLVYYLFHRKRLGNPIYGNYDLIRHKLEVAIYSLDGCVDFNGSSICTSSGTTRQLDEITEHIGEAIGLSVISRLHGMTEADWSPIPQQRGRGASPTFDFEIASDGGKFIQVENKGSSVADNTHVSDAVREQKRKISEKKEKLIVRANNNRDPFPAGIRYGTITAIDPRRDGRIKCWLADPEAEAWDINPNYFKLLTRMRFLHRWISFVITRSQLTSALATRISDLERMQNPFELDGSPLVRSDGEPFEFFPRDIRSPHLYFTATKSRVTDGPSGGVVFQLTDEELFFVGIQEALIMMAAAQKFAEISEFKMTGGIVPKEIQCVFSKNRFARLHLPHSVHRKVKEGGGYMSFSLEGQIHYSQSGLAFGVLPLPPD